MRLITTVLVSILAAAPAHGQRARDLGVPFEGAPGPANAITDVTGLEVGHATVSAGKNVRTGVTAILPRGKARAEPVFAGWFRLNGNGEMTGTTWLEESGFLYGPVLITNTHSVGLVRDATIEWLLAKAKLDGDGWSLPVVAETWDGYLNDINGFHVKKAHVFKALDGAKAGPVPEGNVGGGTGMICHEFKGGIGTSSRKLEARAGGYVVGVLVQCNYGLRDTLTLAGVPVGKELRNDLVHKRETGSIIVVVATDAPLLPHQLDRLARRVALGLGRTGSVAGNGSGDIFLAFSTANPSAGAPEGMRQVSFLPNEEMNALFVATVQATEEAVANALVAARTMTGLKGRRVVAIDHEKLRAVMKKYNR